MEEIFLDLFHLNWIDIWMKKVQVKFMFPILCLLLILGKPQSSAANNYFSPIYLKFNVRQLFDKSSAGNATTPIASKQTPTQEAETSGVETATSSSNGPIKPSTSSSSSSSSLSSSKQQNNDSTAFSNKRMRVDSIIEKLKP